MFARERLAEKIGLPEARIQVSPNAIVLVFDLVTYNSLFSVHEISVMITRTFEERFEVNPTRFSCSKRFVDSDGDLSLRLSLEIE